jgi:hypothetical protein
VRTLCLGLILGAAVTVTIAADEAKKDAKKKDAPSR